MMKQAYATGGSRAFDADFMANVYERPFEVVACGQAPDAEHIVFVQAHSARQRGDVAIVADSHRHVADLLGCADIDVFDLGIKQVSPRMR